MKKERIRNRAAQAGGYVAIAFLSTVASCVSTSTSKRPHEPRAIASCEALQTRYEQCSLATIDHGMEFGRRCSTQYGPLDLPKLERFECPRILEIGHGLLGFPLSSGAPRVQGSTCQNLCAGAKTCGAQALSVSACVAQCMSSDDLVATNEYAFWDGSPSCRHVPGTLARLGISFAFGAPLRDSASVTKHAPAPQSGEDDRFAIKRVKQTATARDLAQSPRPSNMAKATPDALSAVKPQAIRSWKPTEPRRPRSSPRYQPKAVRTRVLTAQEKKAAAKRAQEVSKRAREASRISKRNLRRGMARCQKLTKQLRRHQRRGSSEKAIQFATELTGLKLSLIAMAQNLSKSEYDLWDWLPRIGAACDP